MVGADGFLGRALTRTLREGGSAVTTLGRGDRLVDPGGVAPPALAAASTVFYLASTMNPLTAVQEPQRGESDLAALRGVLGALAGVTRPVTLVLPSSGGTVYDTTLPPPYDEEAPVRAVTAYGRAKLRMEEALFAAARGPCRPVVLRIANVYGPDQPVGTGQGVVASWLDAALRGEEGVLYGDDRAIRDYVYLDDVTRAFVRCAAEPPAPALVNIGSGRATTLAELASAISAVVGEDRFRLRHESARSFDLRHNVLAVDRARAELGWKAEVGLADGLARTWRHLLARAGGL